MKIMSARFLIALATVLLAANSAFAQFNVRTVDSNGTFIQNINEAEALLSSQPTAGTDSPDAINYAGNFPGVTGDDFAMEAIGVVDIIGGTTVTTTLYVNSDDGFRLRLNGVVIAEFIGTTTGSDTTIPNITLNDGDVIRLTYFQRNVTSFIRLRLLDDTSAFVGSAASGIDVLPASFPPPANSAWTTAGSSGATEDESNPARPTYTNQTASLNPGSPAGTYILRYDITATVNLTGSGATNTRLRVRFRDEGDGSRVIVAILRSPVNGGVATVGTTFDSDSFTPGSGFQTQEITFPAATFDFVNNVYWLEVTMTKASAANQPGFGLAQIIQQ